MIGDAIVRLPPDSSLTCDTSLDLLWLPLLIGFVPYERGLSGPISRETAILSPKMVRYTHLVLSFTQAHLCDTPFCNISRDNCAIPHKNKHKRVLRYYRCKYRAILKSIATGPLRTGYPLSQNHYEILFIRKNPPKIEKFT